jgi:hypothetical protein
MQGRFSRVACLANSCNQQGTNDASSIKERYRILSGQLRMPVMEV